MSGKELVMSRLSAEPKTQMDLEALTGIDRREVRRIIGLLRDDGVKICSGTLGFWLWDGVDGTWAKTQATIRRKAISSLQRAEKMGALPIEGQMTLAELLGARDVVQ